MSQSRSWAGAGGTLNSSIYRETEAEAPSRQNEFESINSGLRRQFNTEGSAALEQQLSEAASLNNLFQQAWPVQSQRMMGEHETSRALIQSL
ncbi:unnamed protein product [Pleuronectes platessa]|uniref:Uncharacterized protein n=1 Tax=Pleuronectes platessa TaxID=8262 RepID=A0A9N7Z7W9_PLEPL|nr:unnamed protein product [Pleuronectes platessa]